MSVTREDVMKVAKLARIEVPSEQLNSLSTELNDIIKFVEQLNELSCDAVEPIFSITVDSMPERKDIITDENDASDILANAPEQLYGMFSVPKVI